MRPLAVIEMGGGIGTMFDRTLDWALTPHLQYTLDRGKPRLPDRIANPV
jgi:hypothetical protein